MLLSIRSDYTTGFCDLNKDELDIKRKMNVRLGDDLTLRLIFDALSGEASGESTGRSAMQDIGQDMSSAGKSVEMSVAKYEKASLHDEVSTQL